MKRLVVVGILVGLGLGAKAAIAQVTADGTLSTTVTQTGNNFAIDNGDRAGNNLFHSFGQFSVPTNGAAIFNNAVDVQNIFSRVTGGSISNIDGVIRANGIANLFLLNPIGILFGPNASLNIGGSFIGTTANSMKFADGVEFSATNPTARPLLTMSVPTGLQMGQNPGSIIHQGATLQVSSGLTLALVGGDITQVGGQLRVDGGSGRIELASLGENSTVGINSVAGGWSFDTHNAQSFRDLQFTQQALVDGSGAGSAAIMVVGRNLLVSDSSIIKGHNQGDTNGGTITVHGSESLRVQESSEIRAEAAGAGNAGNLLISAPRITLNNQGYIVSVAVSGTGNAGAISLQGQDVTITSDPQFLITDNSSRPSGIVSVTLDRGKGSDITVLADTLNYSNGGGLANLTFGQGDSGTTTLISKTMRVGPFSGGSTTTTGPGNGGDLNIITDSFYMDGSSGYSTNSFGTPGGRAGNINVTAKSIIARDDGGFVSDTFGTGSAGNITFKADYIELDDTQLNSRTAGIGNAGNISISSQTLRLLNGGQLNVATKASGNGGNITVYADAIELNGEPTRVPLANKNTGIVSGVLPDLKNPNALTGNGGNINLTSSSLVIRDGALISASTSAGNGNGGNIALQVDRLDAFNGGQILNVTRSAGNAGTITLRARDRIVFSGSDSLSAQRQLAYAPGQEYSDVEYNIGPFSGIYANATPAAGGSGGSLQITGDELRLQEGARVTVSSQGTGGAGDLIVNLNRLRLDQQASLRAESVAGDNGNLFLNVGQALILRRGSTITTNATGTANGGNISINAPIILGLENSDIVANALQGRGGNIQITTQGMFGLQFRPQLTSENDITASSQFGINGMVQINTMGIDPNSGLLELPISLSDSSQQVAQGCAANQGSSFVITGRGGVPLNPMTQMSSDRPWTDTRDLSPYRSQRVIHIQFPIPAPLVEATGWRRNWQGHMELFVATEATPTPTAAAVTCATAIRSEPTDPIAPFTFPSSKKLPASSTIDVK